jgi:hypothetical protein
VRYRDSCAGMVTESAAHDCAAIPVSSALLWDTHMTVHRSSMHLPQQFVCLRLRQSRLQLFAKSCVYRRVQDALPMVWMTNTLHPCCPAGGGFGMQAEAGPMAPCADDGTLSTDLQQYLYMGRLRFVLGCLITAAADHDLTGNPLRCGLHWRRLPLQVRRCYCCVGP